MLAEFGVIASELIGGAGVIRQCVSSARTGETALQAGLAAARAGAHAGLGRAAAGLIAGRTGLSTVRRVRAGAAGLTAARWRRGAGRTALCHQPTGRKQQNSRQQKQFPHTLPPEKAFLIFPACD